MSDSDHPVVAALHEAEEQFHAVVSSLRSSAEAEHQEAEKQHKEAEKQRRRAEHLQKVMQNIHRGLFSGDTYTLILEACLKLTHASRGLYLTAPGQSHQGQSQPPRVRASIGNDDYRSGDYPNGVSPYLACLAERAAQGGEIIVSNHPADVAGLPAAEPSLEFRSFAAAPVALMRGLSGVIIVADSESGEFEDEDIQALIHVGSQAGVAVENAELRQKLQNAYLATVSVLADAMEAKDPYTRGHCEMVSRFARLIARRLDLPARERSIVGYAALLHDIGKIGVSDGILNKPSALLPEERDLVRSHVRVGYDLLRHVPALSLVAEAVLHHHEWFDGSGYPDGLKGDQIPIASRIVCVVDSYGAMVTRRSYKEAYGEEYARAELARCAGSQFDSGIVEAFLHILEEPLPDDANEEGEEIAPLPEFLPTSRL